MAHDDHEDRPTSRRSVSSPRAGELARARDEIEELKRQIASLHARLERAERHPRRVDPTAGADDDPAEGPLSDRGAVSRAVLDHLPAGVVVHGPDSRILYSNRTAQNILGLSGDQLSGRVAVDPRWRFVREDGSPMPLEEYPVSRVLSSGDNLQGYVLGVVRPTTEDLRWALCNAFAARAQGRITEVFVSFNDITELKLSEQALRDERRRLASVLDTLGDPVFVKDADHRLLLANRAFCDVFGMDLESVLGKTLAEHVPEDERTQFLAVDRGVLDTGVTDEREETLTLEGKGTRHIITRKSRIIEPSGRRLLVGSIHDITTRRQAEAALRRSERLLDATSQIAQVGGWHIDLGTQRLSWTPEVYRLHEVDETFVPTVPAAIAFYAPDSRPVIEEAVRRALEDGEPFDLELELITAKGTLRWVHATGRSRTEDGRPVDVMGTIQDITTRRIAEAERDKLEAQLRQAQKIESVGRLAGGVAHDFNNMLTVILGNSQLALKQVAPDTRLHMELAGIREAAQRSAELTAQLLAFARKQVISPQVLDLNETVSGLVTMLQRLIGEDIDLVWRPGARLWRVKVDPSQIDQLLVNLCVNARDAIADVGKVTIETHNRTLDEAYCATHAGYRPGEYVQIAVSDDGCGMDQQTLTYIFEPFFSTKGSGSGTGLGLAMVYGVVKQNGGFINVYSEPGEGTSFTIYWPRFVEVMEPPSPAPARLIAQPGHETVLVVEDEPAILRLTTRMLTAHGYAVIAAGTPAEAIRLAEKHAGEIDLLITDVVMPEMNGRDLAERLQALYPSLRRLFMSGYTANVIAHHGVLDAGVNFLQKPFTVEELTLAVRTALDANDPAVS